MLAIAATIAAGAFGVVAARAALHRLTTDGTPRDPHVYWLLGVVALLPAWLIAFVALLPTTPGARPQLLAGAVWVASAGTALAGVILSESRTRTASEAAVPDLPDRCWRLGVRALLPACLLALLGHLLLTIAH